MAFHETEHNIHQAEQNESCPAQEKPDLDAVQVSTLKFQEETGLQNFTPKNKVLISFEPLLDLHQQNYQPVEDLNTKIYQIWGNQSEFSSGVYRL